MLLNLCDMDKGSSSLLLIQNDWNSILCDVGAEAWISCKSKDSPGIHGKLRTVKSLPDVPSVSISEGFEILSVTSTSIAVKHQDCPHTTVFVAPHRTYTAIHKGSSIGSIDVNNESIAVTYCSKGELLVWDTGTEEVKVRLSGHVSEVYKCGFFPSGKVVLSCGSDMTLRIWCARSGQCPVILKGHTMAVTDFAFIGKGKNVLSTSKDGKVKLWNCGDSTCIADIATANSSINCCKVVEAPPYLNVSQTRRSDKEVETENKLVVFGCEDGLVECVAIASRQALFAFTFDSAINCLTVLGDHQFIFGCQNGQIFLYNFKNLENRRLWYESNSAVLSLLPYRNIGFFASRADGSVVFFSIEESGKRISLTGPNFDPVYDMTSDGKYLYTSCRDGSVRLYIVENIINSLF